MFSRIQKCLCIMCLHCKGLHISLVCVNIPIVELLLSWLGLFHLSSIINDLFPYCHVALISSFKRGTWFWWESKTLLEPVQVLTSHDRKDHQGRLLNKPRDVSVLIIVKHRWYKALNTALYLILRTLEEDKSIKAHIRRF